MSLRVSATTCQSAKYKHRRGHMSVDKFQYMIRMYTQSMILLSGLENSRAPTTVQQYTKDLMMDSDDPAGKVGTRLTVARRP